MLRILFIIMIISFNSFALEAVNFSVRFGGAQVNTSDIETTGTGFNLQSELFFTNEWGMLLGYGYTKTDSNSSVTTASGSRKYELSIDNSFLQAGGFMYLFPGFRVAAGLSSHNVEVEFNRSGRDTNKSSATLMGPFASVGYSHPIGRLLLGAEYNYMKFAEYDQSALFFLIGLLI